MIYVDGVLFEGSSADQGSSDLIALMEHPVLASASFAFRAIPEKKFSTSEASSDGLTMSKHVYLFQREYATVNPALVDLIGTDEATTCVGVVIRNRNNGMTTVAHMDSPKIVDVGLSQMLSKLIDHTHDAELDVHLIGGFEDSPFNHSGHGATSEGNSELDGHSLPLCTKIIEALGKSVVKFHVQTLFVLGHNTRIDEGNVLPIFSGFLVETLTGTVIPASFDETTRCPDELVRRIRVSASFEDPHWRGKLLETYDTGTDRFVIAPCAWNARLVRMASFFQQLPDSELLHTCSTSPLAEAPDFVVNQRRQWDYLIKHPNWRETFRMGQPRVFKRTANRGWMTEEQAHEAVI